MFIDRSCSQLHSNARFMGRSVEFVNSVDLLEVPLYVKCSDALHFVIVLMLTCARFKNLHVF